MQQIVTQVRAREWLEMIHAQKESGLSIQRWCKENNISENCYYYRKSKLRETAGSGLTQFIDITRPAQEAENTRGRFICTLYYYCIFANADL